MNAAPVVLVVEDDPQTSRLIHLLLCEEGYLVRTAPDGETALTELERHAPSLILLDLRLPGISGWEVLERYQERPGPHAPVIVLSADGRALELAVWRGAAAYLRKPFEVDDLLALIRRYTQWDPPGRE